MINSLQKKRKEGVSEEMILIFHSHRKKHHGSRYLQMGIASLFYMQYLCRQQKKYFNDKKTKERQITL